MGPKRNTPTYIIIKLPKIKDKEKILKAAREKETVAYKRVPMRLSGNFSKQTLQARRGWKVFETMKTNIKHTTGTGTESEKRTSHRGSSVGRGKGGVGGERYREKEA